MAEWQNLKELIRAQVSSLTAINNDTGLTSVNTQFSKVAKTLPALAVTNPGVAIGSGSKAKVLIDNTVEYLIGGVWKQKTTAEIDFVATTHDIPAHATLVQCASYTLSLDAAGTGTLTMGTITSGTGTSVPPVGPVGECTIGYVTVEVDAGATPFNASTDLLDAAHLTSTFFSVAGIELTTLAAVTVA